MAFPDPNPLEHSRMRDSQHESAPKKLLELCDAIMSTWIRISRISKECLQHLMDPCHEELRLQSEALPSISSVLNKVLGEYIKTEKTLVVLLVILDQVISLQCTTALQTTLNSFAYISMIELCKNLRKK